MSRRRLAAFLAAGGALAAVLLASLAAWGGTRGALPGIAVHEVRRGAFVRRVAAEGYLKAQRATPIAIPPRGQNLAFKAAWIAEDGARVRAGDPVALFDPTDLEKALLDSRDDVTSAARRADKARARGDADRSNLDADARVAGLERRHAETYSDLDPQIHSRNEILESVIDRDLASRKADHASWKAGTSERQTATEIQIQGLQKEDAAERVRQAETALAMLRLTAPHDGLLVLQRDWRGDTTRVGDSVFPGETIAEIPDLGVMEARVYVLEADAGGLEPGRRATVVLSSRPDAAFPGEVTRVDALAKTIRQGVPVQYFETILSLSPPPGLALKPGQRVRAEIVLEEVGNALAVPRQAIFDRDGRRIAWRLEGGSFRPVDVTVGRFGLGTALVESGLAEGDRIALRDPDAPAAGGSPKGSGKAGSPPTGDGR